MGSTRWGSNSPEYNKSARKSYEYQDQLQGSINNYSGNAGYQNSLEQGKIGAQTASIGAEQAAARTARTGGMSSAAASTMGGAQAAKGYYDAFNQQQNNAYQSGIANIQGKNSLVQNQNQLSQLALQHKKDTYAYSWNNMRFALNSAGDLLGAAANVIA